MHRDVGAQVPRALARPQVREPHEAPAHEAQQGHDGHGHVQVEDLLHEALVGVEGVEEVSPVAAARTAAVANERGPRPLPYRASVLHEEVEHGHG